MPEGAVEMARVLRLNATDPTDPPAHGGVASSTGREGLDTSGGAGIAAAAAPHYRRTLMRRRPMAPSMPKRCGELCQTASTPAPEVEIGPSPPPMAHHQPGRPRLPTVVASSLVAARTS